jgi:hypothetical protein
LAREVDGFAQDARPFLVGVKARRVLSLGEIEQELSFALELARLIERRGVGRIFFLMES